MTSSYTLESASSLFGDAPSDNSDFFGSLHSNNSNNGTHPVHESGIQHAQDFSELEDVNFTNANVYNQQTSGTDVNFYENLAEHRETDHYEQAMSSGEHSYEPTHYNTFHPVIHSGQSTANQSWYNTSSQPNVHLPPVRATSSYSSTYTSSSYDPYTPQANATIPAPHGPSRVQPRDPPASPPSSFSVPTAPAPAPTTSDVNSFRMTSKNAYDPPIPTSRRNRNRMKPNSESVPFKGPQDDIYSQPTLPADVYDSVPESRMNTNRYDPDKSNSNFSGRGPYRKPPPGDSIQEAERETGPEISIQGQIHTTFSDDFGIRAEVPLECHRATEYHNYSLREIHRSHDEKLSADYPQVANTLPDSAGTGGEIGQDMELFDSETFVPKGSHPECVQDGAREPSLSSKDFCSWEVQAMQPSVQRTTQSLIEDVPNSTACEVDSKTTALTHTPHDPYAPSSTKSPSTVSPQQIMAWPQQVLQHGVAYGASASERSLGPTGVQYVSTTASFQYAPSPSLLGSNDPLQRASSRTPVFSFGFGGHVVSCFHLSQTNSGGFDVAMSSQDAKNIRLRLLHDVLPPSTVESSGLSTSFPGPLFADPGSVSTGIISTGVSSNIKSKKAAVLKYLGERLDEMEKGVGHISRGSLARQKSESKVKLVQLLRVLVENDGIFSGNPMVENAVRDVLCPQTAGGLTFNSIAMPYSEQPLATSSVKLSTLSKIEEFLLAGERRQACQYALDEKLWGHAMLIARGLDTDAWLEVVQLFVKTELDVLQQSASLASENKGVSGLNGLKVAYGLFGGLGASSLQNLSKVQTVGNGSVLLKGPQLTPMAPNYIPPPPSAPTLAIETISQWPKIASVAFSNPVSGYSAALTSLGDHLALNHWIEAAHCCYLLSPQTSALGGAGQPSTKAVLLGSPDPVAFSSFDKDMDPFIFTEIAEFALSLVTQQKSQDVFSGLAHLQPYRLIRAYQLADLGHTAMATRYCEAIGTSLRLYNKPSPYHTQCFLEHLKGLSERLAGVPLQEKSKSWVIGKVARPSLDSLGGWLEGRITKFIAGDGEISTAAEHGDATYQIPQYSGAFSGYSAISSAHTSQCPSPSPSLHQNTSSQSNLQNYPPRPPSVNRATVNINRASSAMDGARNVRTSSPIARIASAIPSTKLGAIGIESLKLQSSASGSEDFFNAPASSSNPNWWDKDETTSRTPVAATFYQVDRGETNEGFHSLLEDSSLSFVAASSTITSSKRGEEEEEEDLGFGNSKSKPEKPKSIDIPQSAHTNQRDEPSAKDDKIPAIKPAASSSWLDWLWKRGESQNGGVVQAKLGEERSTFYYDKELKRWVNSKAPPTEDKLLVPPPPPSRQATVPPETAPPYKSEFGKTDAFKGPIRPASAAAPPRAKSIAASEGSVSSLPPTTSKPLTGTPPSSRPSTRTSNKRNIRSRYVDVLHESQNISGR